MAKAAWKTVGNCTFISLGAGVQSSTMALMAKHGEITPRPEAAIFADTQHESKTVYAWIDWLEKQLPFPVIRITKGSLWEGITRVKRSAGGRRYINVGVPAFLKTENGKAGFIKQGCTFEYKIRIIWQKYNQLRKKRRVEQWIGISFDEVSRMKPARRSWITNRYPLVDLRMTRQDCLNWMQKRGYPRPPRSACIFWGPISLTPF